MPQKKVKMAKALAPSLPKDWNNLDENQQNQWVRHPADQYVDRVVTWSKKVTEDIEANRDAYRNGKLGFHVSDSDMDAVVKYAQEIPSHIESALGVPKAVPARAIDDKWSESHAIAARKAIQIYTNKLNFREEPVDRLLKRINKDNVDEQLRLHWQALHERGKNHSEWINEYGNYDGPQPWQVVEKNTPKMKAKK